jgi:glutathione S-transferase
MKIAGTSLKPLEVWRSDVGVSDALEFARSIAAAALRGGSGSHVTGIGPRPAQQLVLFQRETCPFSRLVREALSQLDLDALIKPCPEGERVQRAELSALSGEHKIPFLVDAAAGVQLGESRRIVEHLFERYGRGALPWPLRWQTLAESTSRLATAVRGKELSYVAPAVRPEQPLELWNYEASPYCRVVRERLDALGLPYVSHNLARNSPRRRAFLELHGKLQFPYLFDPNTGARMFESDLIVRHIEQRYASCLELLAAVAQAHLA